MVQRRNPVPVVHTHGARRTELHERARLPALARHGKLLLSQPAERETGVVPRSRHRDHTTQCVRRHCCAYIITDDFEASLVNSGLLPDLIGIPLVIQDKGFVGPHTKKQDPSWKWGGPGSLWYPHDYEANDLGGQENPKGRWDWGPTADEPAPRNDATSPDVSRFQRRSSTQS